MACHNQEHGSFCKVAQSIGSGIKANCIDCHMPLMPSKVLSVDLENHQTPVPAMIRKHYIAVYPAATQKFLNSLK
jgi:nitrate/TMAO reductase-like tetraheme cytochrome c subunit